MPEKNIFGKISEFENILIRYKNHCDKTFEYIIDLI